MAIIDLVIMFFLIFFLFALKVILNDKKIGVVVAMQDFNVDLVFFVTSLGLSYYIMSYHNVFAGILIFMTMLFITMVVIRLKLVTERNLNNGAKTKAYIKMAFTTIISVGSAVVLVMLIYNVISIPYIVNDIKHK